ncbi:MAG: UDP-N-acetylglucosamine 2-epimerase [Emcibacteraceae bacterium]|nr:UDP-N-acetylglucosamine 2-epimerase [Emcibacteraceae bacterium]
MKIIAITTIRSDYDLMSNLYRELDNDMNIEFKLLVAGTHISPTYGLTVQEIENDNFDILIKSETLLDSDSKVGRLKSASIMLLSFIDAVANYEPDLILYAGDREDVAVGALLGAYLSIPTMHFFSGDHAADGHVDNPIRHATAKLTTFHCASVEQHAERLRAIGEPDERISIIGSIALDKFLAHKNLPLKSLFDQLNIETQPEKLALIIFHPIEEEKKYACEILRIIISELLSKGIYCFVGAPNSDPNNRQLLNLDEEYSGSEMVYFYKNMPREMFLTIFNNSELIIGNSSAGILEAASIPIPTVNVGARQVGRLAGKNVIFCDAEKKSIKNAIERALSKKFKSFIANIENPYGDGKSVEKALNLIKTINFVDILYKKEDPLYVNKDIIDG